MKIHDLIQLIYPTKLAETDIPPQYAGETAVILDKNITGHFSVMILSKPGYLFDITKDHIERVI